MKFSLYFSVFLALATFFAGCSPSPQNPVSQKSDSLKVQTQTVVEYRTVRPVRSIGRLSSKTESKLSFKTGGIIHRVFVEQGQSVRKGQVLAQLDLSEIRARVEQAQQAFEKATRDLQRAQALFRDSVATLEQYQNAQTALQVAKSDLEIAQFNLKHSKIFAPANGKILKRLAEPNELIAPGHPLLLFASTDKKWVVRVNLADRDIVRIKPGDRAVLSFDAFPAEKIAARVSETGSFADPYTGTFEAELTLENDTFPFVSGFIARAEIFPAKTRKVFGLPTKGLLTANGNTGYVYKMQGDSAIKTRVSIYEITDSMLLVEKGVKPGDKIITQGANYVGKKSIVVNARQK